MTAEPRRIKRKSPGNRPASRTVEVRIPDGDFAGWSAVVRVDFPARLLEDMESGNVSRIIAAAERLIVSHDMPDSDGNVAESIADVDPFPGVVAVLSRAMSAIQALPPR